VRGVTSVLVRQERFVRSGIFSDFLKYEKCALLVCCWIFCGSVYMLILIIFPERSILSCVLENWSGGFGRGGSFSRFGGPDAALKGDSVSESISAICVLFAGSGR